MTDNFENQDWVKLGVASALNKEFAADQKRFLVLFAETLRKQFPDESKVLTKGLFTKTTVGVEVDLGEYRYKVEDPGNGHLKAYRTKVVRGIALKTEEIPMPVCMEEISDTIELRAQQSGGSRAALARLLGLE